MWNLAKYNSLTLALEAFKNNNVYHKNIKVVLKSFCEKLQSRVLSPIKDSAGQSLYVDDYLGGRNSQLILSIKWLLIFKKIMLLNVKTFHSIVLAFKCLKGDM